MAKITKQFTVEEYYKDYKYITNSHLQYWKKCPYYYEQKRHGKVVEIEKDYFTYGKAVDTLLSNEKLEDKFFIGTKPKKSVEEYKKELQELEEKMKQRAEDGKMPLKSQTEKLQKLQEQIEAVKNNEDKIRLTETMAKNVKESVAELRRQKIYRAFENAGTQTIIATEIDGIKVKGMIDKLDLKNGILEDDKTTANMTTFDPNMYVPQLSWYRWLVREVFEIEVDCYLSVVDKNSDFKRSAFYHISKARLDWQEELNKEDLQQFVRAIKSKKYPSVIELQGQEARQEVCYRCDHYPNCKFTIQNKFITI